MVVLDVVLRLRRHDGVFLHHVVVHQRLGSEQAEAAGAAEHAAEHVLGRLVKPVSDGVFKLLVPNDGPCQRNTQLVTTWYRVLTYTVRI